VKAIVQDHYGSYDTLRYADIDRPAPGTGEVLIKVQAAGVDPGTWHVMTGLPRLIRLAGFGVRRPKVRVRGREVAGRIEAVGAGVTRFAVGDEVFGTSTAGTFAEYATAGADRLVAKPANLTAQQVAAVPVSGCAALQAVRDRGQVRAGQRVLVIGAGGGIGTYAVQLAHHAGAEVTGVCSTSKVDLVRSLGATHVVDYTRSPLDSAGTGYDVVIDIAGLRPLSELRPLLARRGTLVMVGGEDDGKLVGGAVVRQLRAALAGPFTGQRLRPLLASEPRSDLEVLAAMLASGALTPAIDRTFPLADAGGALRYLMEGHAHGKVVVVP
jgi:NADPH:quinone reductase-like Zn-dependent oxidoreductase